MNAASRLVHAFYYGDPLRSPLPEPDVQVIRYKRGKPVLTLERVAHPPPCAGFEDACCPHHGPMVQKRMRRAFEAAWAKGGDAIREWLQKAGAL